MTELVYIIQIVEYHTALPTYLYIYILATAIVNGSAACVVNSP